LLMRVQGSSNIPFAKHAKHMVTIAIWSNYVPRILNPSTIKAHVCVVYYDLWCYWWLLSKHPYLGSPQLSTNPLWCVYIYGIMRRENHNPKSAIPFWPWKNKWGALTKWVFWRYSPNWQQGIGRVVHNESTISYYFKKRAYFHSVQKITNLSSNSQGIAFARRISALFYQRSFL
jgi:hypothetical protein